MSDYLKLADVKVLDKTEGGPASIPGGGRMALVDFQIHYKVLPGPFHFAEGTLAWDQLHGFVEAMYEVTGNGIDQAIQSGKFEGDHKFQALFQKHESGWRMDSVMKSLD